MEDIKRQIEEFIEKQDIRGSHGFYKIGVYDGANFVLQKWQEAERWRDLEKDPPIVKEKSYAILLKDESGDTHNGYGTTEFDETEDIQRLLRFYTHWKLIN